MIYPTLNNNGTSGKYLKEELVASINAINAAKTSLRNCSPHGRDYPADKIESAIEEHYTRIKRLADVIEELMQIALNIQQQQDR